jgi:hypothetical protein
MPRLHLRRLLPTPLMSVALVAVFIALGGPAQAARVIDGGSIRAGTITGRQVKDRSLSTRDLRHTAVRALRTTETADLAVGAVTAPKLASGAVTSAAIADGGVGAAALAAGAVGSGQLVARAVTASKVADSAIGGAALADGSLQTVDVGSFTGALQVDFNAFAAGACQSAEAAAVPAGATNDVSIADDVVAVSPAAGWPDQILVNAKPAPGNRVRLVACYVAPDGLPPIDAGPALFRYVTFDSP